MMEHIIPLPAPEASADAPRRTALLLAYRFPPHESIASHRAQALYRHLGRYGWQPLVVTTRTEGAAADVVQTDDPSLAGKLEGQGGFDPSRDAHPAARFGKLVGYAWQAVKGVLRHMPRWHDRYAQWSYGIVDEAVRVGRERRAELVWATLSPLSLAPAAVRIARQLGVPCVLDLRDPPEEGLGGAPARWLTEALRAADAVTVAAPSCITPLVLGARGGQPPLILSGSWHAGAIEPEPGQQFRIVHAGTWHRSYDAGPLLSALARLSLDLPDFANSARAVFIGKGSNWVREAVNFDAAAPMVELAGLTPYAQVQHELRRASVLLIARGGDAHKASAITGKIFDYAAYETPVLSIGGRHDLHSELVGWLGSGLWTDRVDEITDLLRTQYARWLQTGTTRVERSLEALAYLSQPRMAGEFAAVFDAARNGTAVQSREEYPWATERQPA